MNNKELEIASKIIDAAVLIAELKAENKILNDINDKLMKVLGETKSDFEKCEKCGVRFMPHLMNPLTICDNCSGEIENRINANNGK